MTAPRPLCVHCRKPYGRRAIKTFMIRWPIGENGPPYTGEEIHIRDRCSHEAFEGGGIQYGPGFKRVEIPITNKFMTAQREIWDGKSWEGGYYPFCTLRCALDYARQAWRSTKKKA